MEVERVVALVALVALVVVYGKCMGILWYLCILGCAGPTW